MSKEREALKLALECIERGGGIKEGNTVYLHDRELMRIARDAIREALVEQPAQTATYTRGVCGVSMHMEQPAQQQEPVAEVRLMRTGGNAGIATHIVQIVEGYFPAGTKLYTSPQPSKPWVGLTKKEVYDLYESDYAVFHQRIEAKLKEKNA